MKTWLDRRMELHEYLNNYHIYDYTDFGDTEFDLCDKCGHGDFLWYDFMHSGFACENCGYENITTLDTNVYSPSFMKWLTIDKHVIYNGKAKYKTAFSIEERKSILLRSLIILYDEIDKAINGIENHYMSVLENSKNELSEIDGLLDYRYLTSTLTPVYVWSNLFEGMEFPPETLEEAYLMLDTLVEVFNEVDVKLYEELSNQEEQSLIEDFTNNNLEYSSLTKFFPNEFIYCDLLGYINDDEDCFTQVDRSLLYKREIKSPFSQIDIKEEPREDDDCPF